jgi:hypothetical protein
MDEALVFRVTTAPGWTRWTAAYASTWAVSMLSTTANASDAASRRPGGLSPVIQPASA